jgi:hypothetical protein
MFKTAPLNICPWIGKTGRNKIENRYPGVKLERFDSVPPRPEDLVLSGSFLYLHRF